MVEREGAPGEVGGALRSTEEGQGGSAPGEAC